MRLKRLHTRFLALPIWLRLTISSLLFISLMILTQNFQIFPGAVRSILESTERVASTLPKGVESIFIRTRDEEMLEVWRLPAKEAAHVAIIFHGNGATIQNFFPYQRYFKQLGITSYGFVSRGFGMCSGWPSEQGLYLDAEAVVDFVLRNESIAASKLLLVGISIGSGPASYAAFKYNPNALILFSPFQSLPAAVSAVPLFGILHPFTLYEFPVERFVSSLKQTCLLVVHGKKDSVVPFEQGRRVFDSYVGQGFSKFLLAEDAEHNDIINKVYAPLARMIPDCLASSR